MAADWRQELADAVTDPVELGQRFDLDGTRLATVAARYPMRITPHYLTLLKGPDDPLWKQCVPDMAELEEDGQIDDPLAEEALSPVPGLIHRYPDRALLLVSSSCALYCRFCMRKRGIGCGSAGLGGFDADAAISYIAAHDEIRDVILSGGDPLLLDDDRLGDLLGRIRAIPHVEVIRIGSRVPVTLPSRITPELCSLLSRFHPLYINTHFNHPDEITPASASACALLADAGIQLGNQTVLLRGINDDTETMARLLRGLLRIRVRPYYLHQMDLVRGTAHFRTPVAKGMELVQSLRGNVSGLAIPQFVVDLPGGRGKVPLLPENFRRLTDASCRIVAPGGEEVVYGDVVLP